MVRPHRNQADLGLVILLQEFTSWDMGLHSLYSWAASLLALSQTVIQHSTSTPLSEPERHSFTPQKGGY
jgi:hypothetical protein